LKPITITQTIAGKEFSTTLQPTDVTSYGCKPPAYGIEPDERVHVASLNGVATLHCSNFQDRERLAKLLRKGQLAGIRVGVHEVFAIKLVLFERGWPDQQNRTIRFQDVRADYGYESYAKSVLPALQSSGAMVMLTRSHHPYRLLRTVPKDKITGLGLNGNSVVFQDPETAVGSHVVIVTANSETAKRLGGALKANQVHTLELNEAVLSFVLVSANSIKVYGYEKLPKNLNEAFAGYKQPFRYYYQEEPYWEVNQGLNGFPGAYLLRAREVVK
jgi:hypothetical protein